MAKVTEVKVIVVITIVAVVTLVKVGTVLVIESALNPSTGAWMRHGALCYKAQLWSSSRNIKEFQRD